MKEIDTIFWGEREIEYFYSVFLNNEEIIN